MLLRWLRKNTADCDMARAVTPRRRRSRAHVFCIVGDVVVASTVVPSITARFGFGSADGSASAPAPPTALRPTRYSQRAAWPTGVWLASQQGRFHSGVLTLGQRLDEDPLIGSARRQKSRWGL